MSKKVTRNVKRAMKITTASLLILTQAAPTFPIYGQEKDLHIDIMEKAQETQRIGVTIFDSLVKTVSLYKGNRKMETKEASQEIYFDVYQNGDYRIIGEDQNGQGIAKEMARVNSFEELSVSKDTQTQELMIISRMPSTNKIIVSGVAKNTLEAGINSNENVTAVFKPEKNGKYVFTAIDINGEELGTIDYQVNGIPDKEGNIIVQTEEDLKQVIQNPEGNYALGADITLTNDILQNVDFKGKLDGKGYRVLNVQENFFKSVTGATIHNIVIDGKLAKTANNTVINNSGFYIFESDSSKDAALLLNSENTTIENSFVFADIKGKNVAGFVLDGNATISNSYVSGSLQGEEVYGFGKDVDVASSYISASLIGKNRKLFTNEKIENCFYDAQINDLEETKADSYFTEEITQGNLQLLEFEEEEGKYPQLKATAKFKEEAQRVLAFSVLKVESRSNLNALKTDVKLKVVVLNGEEAIWGGKQVSLVNNNAVLNGTDGEIVATYAGMNKRYTLKSAKTVTEATAGKQTTAQTTQITYPVEIGKYYKIVGKDESISAPSTHEDACNDGWKVMYWDGSYTQTGLNWNSEYDVLSTDLTTNTKIKTVKTEYGKNGGKITLTGNYDLGEVMSATLVDTNTTKGTLYFESASTLDASSWTTVQTTALDEDTSMATYTVTENEANKYLRARFVSDETTGYQGTLETKSKTLVKTMLVSTQIVNRTDTSGGYTLGDQLIVEIEPAGKENEVLFSWYHVGKEEVIATGRNYTLKASDIGEQVYTKAVAKADGELNGEISSASTTVVTAIKNTKPDSIYLNLSSKDDITATIKMNTLKGLYRYGIASTVGGEIKAIPTLSRAGTNTTITGLVSDSTYYIYVQQVGEEGFLDSDWSDGYLTVKTDHQQVRGDVVIRGDTIYNQPLHASTTNEIEGQTGSLFWYRVDSDGNRGTEAIATGETYTLQQEDINKKIEVVFKATGEYTGEFSSITDTIGKEEKERPATNLAITAYDDTWVSVQMPTNSDGEKYIIGISTTSDGVPVEVLESGAVKELASGDSHTINDLQRDTEYYLFIRYASNETHEKSEWIEANKALGQKTNKKVFEGSIDFTYENASTVLRRGQTLIANLNPTDASFNYKGTWIWKKIVDGAEIPIDNFTMTANKQGTQYEVPKNEDLQTTYKVSFTANVGYEGNTESDPSNEVNDIVLEQYAKPIANNIVLKMNDDTSINVSMDEGEGQYQFWYKKADTSALDSTKGFLKDLLSGDDGYSKIGSPVNSNTEVTIPTLDRNTKYAIKVQRVTDSEGEASEYTYSSEATAVESQYVYTDKTSIAGYVSIEESPRFNKAIQAVYNKAEYLSTGSGSDEDGSWQWYAGSEKIEGATAATLLSEQVKEEHIGEILSAEYTLGSDKDFKGSVSAKTNVVGKSTSGNPEVKTVNTSYDTTAKDVKVELEVSASTAQEPTYYRIQGEGTAAPSFPTTTDALATWSDTGNGTLSLTQDSDSHAFTNKGKYVVYLLKTETVTVEASPIVMHPFTIGTLQQTGSITVSGRTHVGKDITATLSDHNNEEGTWHWYYSKTDYNTTNPSEWIEITDGYYPNRNDITSTLIVPDMAKGKYIKAEFIPEEESGYSGKLTSGKSSTSVTKTYTEKLSISGKGYAGHSITVTLENSDRTIEDLTTKNIQYRLNGTYVENLVGTKLTENSYQYTMPNDLSKDGHTLTGVINLPDKKIYTKEDGTELSNNYLDTSNSLTYRAGVTINSAAELQDFITGSSVYTNRTVKYILTENVDMTGLGQVTPTSTVFSGELSGDYHTIVGLQNPIFNTIKGSSTTNKSKISNLIISNGDLSGSTMALIAQKAGNANLEEILLIDTQISDSNDTGLLIALATDAAGILNTGGNVSLKKIGTARGRLTQTRTGKSVGGMIGHFHSSGSNVAEDLFSVNFTMDISANSASGGLFRGAGGSKVQNTYAANTTIDMSGNAAAIAGIASGINNGKNNFYNSTMTTPKASPDIAENNVQVGKITSDMIGDKLKSSFDSSGNNNWVYKDGFYPRLKWTVERGIEAANLYAATKGSFVALDGKTSLTQMFNGELHGSISVPEEFKKDGYSFSSSDQTILKVSDSGTITPVGNVNQSASIIVTYNDLETGATPSAEFSFTVKSKLSGFDGVVLAGSAMLGTTLTAKVTPSVASITYKWYRVNPTTNIRELITSANQAAYVCGVQDIGKRMMVEISASGYGTTASKLSDVVAPAAPNLAPSVSNITDSGFTITGKGALSSNYEYAYATFESEEKVIIKSIGESVIVDNLKRDTNYYVWSRIASGSGYDASSWSPVSTISTNKTEIDGTISFGANLNNGTVFSVRMPDINMQTGTWQLERVKADGTVTSVITILEEDAKKNTLNYTLKDADVGFKIQATYTGSGSFQGTKSQQSAVIKKSIQTAPIEQPQLVTKTDTTLDVTMSTQGTYDIGYSDSASGAITVAATGVNEETKATISGLVRNKMYYVYARKSVTAVNEESPWTNASPYTTDKSSVVDIIAMRGIEQVEESITFEAPTTNGQSGFWKLERVSGSNKANTIAPESYEVSGNTLVYKLEPKDANMQIRATYNGNGDFKDSINKMSQSIQNAVQDEVSNMPTKVVISTIRDYSFRMTAADGSAVYQYGYTLKDVAADPVEIEATANAGIQITASGLRRNTKYDVYVRKAAKQGYAPSDWVKQGSTKTDQSVLTGTIEHVIMKDGAEQPAKVGVATVGETYKAKYGVGSYPEGGDDSHGSWQWYANGIAITDATSDTYTIGEMTGDVEITVKYSAAEGSDFKDSRSASIGTFTKPAFAVPTLPTIVVKEEDGEVGSKIEITTQEYNDVYFYVQKASNTAVPATSIATDVENNEGIADQWFKATASNILTLEADTDYVVYVAKLEDGMHLSSGVISGRSIRTEKEDLNVMTSIEIVEADATDWKVQQPKELRISNHGKVPAGNWQYYVTKDKDVESSWQNITSEIKNELVEGSENNYTYTKVTLPLKYSNDYYVKAVFTGRGAYKGTKTYVSNAKLVGTTIRGHVEMSNSDQVSEIFVPIKVQYEYGKDTEGKDVVDENNGIWTWYRETAQGSNFYEKIIRENNTVGIHDEYRPTVEDVNKKLYAVYTGAPMSIYSGSVQSETLSNIERAEQNAPDALSLKQVNGTTVQMQLPSNYKVDGKTVAQPVLEYRKKEDSDWNKNKVGESWIGRDADKLNANTTYEVRARFDGTIEYKASTYSDILEVTTGNQSFDDDNLSIVQLNVIESGTKISATFTGAGYDEGYFVIKDTSNDTLVAKEDGTVTGNHIEMEYTVTDASIGQNIIIQYQAKGDAKTYSGSIEKNTKEVLKPENPTIPGTPVLRTIRLHEDKLEVDVDETLEYIFDTSLLPPDESSSKWQKLAADTDGNYTFTELQTDVNYYLHVRTAETASYRHSKESISAPTRPWKSSQYTIAYEGIEGAINGTPANPTQYTELSNDIVLNDASKQGYTFLGWTTYDGGTPQKEITITSGSAGNKTYIANWAIDTYDISYELNDGTVTPANPETYTVETVDFTLNNPTKDNYTFLGWTWTGATTPEETVTITKGSTGNLSYTANWTINQYTATFDGNGGNDGTEITADYDSALGTLPTVTRKGHTFVGWFTEDTAGTKVDETTKMPENGATYYAHWTINEYTATFNGNGGNDGTSITKDYDSALGTLPTVARQGYTFVGWFTTADTTGTKVDETTKMPEDGATYYAHWTINQYTAIFDGNGGNNGTSITVDYASALGTLPTSTREGYTFVGWFTTADTTGTKVDETTKMPENGATYYAHWSAINYTISYVLNDSGEGSNHASNPTEYTIETDTIVLEEPSWNGHVFTGWTWDGEANPTKTVTITKGSYGDITYTANWDLNDYVVSFNSQIGSIVDNVPAKHGIAIAKPEDPMRTGYGFQGWYTEAACTNEWDFSDGVTSTMTLYAKWEINSYDVTFDSKGGSSLTKQTIDHGSKVTKPGNPTRSNYTFEAWYSDATYTNVWDFVNDEVTSAMTLYAKWTADTYTISYSMNDGNVATANPTTYTIETDTFTLNNPTKDNYTFLGWTWTGSTTPEETVTITKGSTGNLSYTANWTINQYTATFDGNGGNDGTEITADYDSALGTLPTVTRKGHTFVGWFTEDTAGTKVDETTKMPENGATYYAHWTINEYTATFNGNGGNDGTSITKDYDSALGTLPTVARQGYTFVGWFTTADTTGTKVDETTKMPEDGATYYAHWTINQYTAIFDGNGGNNGTSITVDYDSGLGTLPTSTREGYTFVGWFTTADTTGTKVDETTKMPENGATYYAHWSAINYTISYVLNDSGEGSNHASNPTEYTIETDTIVLEEPSWNGHVFTGWTWDGEANPTKTVTITKGSYGDITYTANWDLNDYVVSFNSQIGSIVDNVPAKHGIAIAKPEDPMRTGYGFQGWYTEAACTNEWDFSDGVTSTMTLYAKWEINSYDVTFDSKGGSSLTKQTIDHGSKVTNPGDPTRSNYTFEAWYSDATYTNVWDFASDEVTSAMTLYAKWTADTYTITYSMNGGSVTPANPETYTVETVDFTLNNPTKDNYTFLGWTWTGSTTPEKTVTIAKGSHGDITYTANWEINQYTATFNGNGGSNGTSITKDYDSELGELPTSTREGHTFVGWFTEAIAGTTVGSTTKMPEDGATYYAHWTINQFTAKFNGNGGNDGADITADYDSALGALPIVTRTGYTFAGWFTEATTGTKVDETTKMPEKGATYYAHWTINEYTASFDGNGGNDGTSITADYDSALGTLPTVTREGYTLVGWFTTANTAGTKVDETTKMPENGATYYAHWSATNYTISYVLNDSGEGSNHASNPTEYTVETENIILGAPSWSGHVFTGWTWDGEANPTKTVTITKGSTGNLSYSANWDLNDYVVHFDSQSGSIVGDIPVKHGIAIAKPTDPLRNGYGFQGWYKEAACTNEWNFNDGVTSTMTLYAKWKINSYDVTFDSKGGDSLTNQTIDHGSKVTQPSAPTRSNYTFDGWYSDAIYTNAWDFTTDQVTSAMTLYAKWTADTYTITYSMDGGTNPATNKTSYTVETDTFTLKEPTKPNHTFLGWTGTGITTPEKTVTITKGSTGNLSYLAKWKINSYDVTFDSKGGDSLTNQTIDHGSKVTKPGNPTRGNYTFDGWYSDEACTNAWDFTTDQVTGAMTLYAKWTADTYTITYSMDGGTNPATNKASYTVETDTFTLKEPTKDNYTFLGWTGTGITTPEKTVTITNGSTGNLSYLANWKINSYDVTFDSKGGDLLTKQTIDHGSKVKKPGDPIRSNYAFKGWYSDATYTSAWDFASDEVTSAITLYAKWTAEIYTISYTLNDGTVTPANPETYTVETVDFTLNNPTKDNYTFLGWTWTGSTTPGKTVTITKGSTGNLSYTANWEINSYDVTFDSKGGNSLTKQTIDHGSKVTNPGNPTRSNYAFEGWYSDATYTSAWDFASDEVTSAMTLYAKWTAEIYTISYTLNDGTVTPANPESYTVETVDFTLNNPTKDNYTFLGWTWTGSTTPEKTVTITKGSHGDITYTANWKISSYDVTFNSDGGSKVTKQNIKHGNKVSKPQEPQKEGYVFSGWYRDAARTAVWDFTSDVVEKDTTIYAKFKLQLSNIESNIASGSHIDKGTAVKLSSKDEANIYYTTDGSAPTKNSTKYTGPITITKVTTIKVIAIKENCIDSGVSEFAYLVNGDVTIEIDKDSPGGTEATKSELIEAVLTANELKEYQSGKDVKVRIACEAIEKDLAGGINNVLDGRIVAKYYDISIYKQIGADNEMLVSKLNKTIRITLTIPKELLPKDGTTRIFDVIRIHDDKAEILNDIDKDETTITIESDKFSTYILCYKDTNTITLIPEKKPVQPSVDVETSDTTDTVMWYETFLVSLGLGAFIVRKKKYRNK